MSAPPSTKAIVSVFTSPTCRGNPAGVVLSPNVLPLSERRQIARTLAQPATAFVTRTGTICWHLPNGTSLPLCGHATAAAVQFLMTADPSLASSELSPSSSISFRYFSDPEPEPWDGRAVQNNGRIGEVGGGGEEGQRGGSAPTSSGTIEGVWHTDAHRFGVDLPAGPDWRVLAGTEKEEVLRMWAAASGLAESVQEAVALPSGHAERGNREFLALRLDPAIDLGRIVVDIEALKRMPFRGIWITSLWPPTHAEEHDTRDAHTSAAIRSRTFFPRVGLDEDEVCGSAHTFLVPWWVRSQPDEFREYKLPSGSYLVPAVQLSPRGGELEVLWNGKSRDEGGRCVLFGHGVVERTL